MRFKSIEYGNFGPFVSVAMALSDLGLVLVQGDNRLSTSADSNGSGKSYLLEGLIWSLFGKTIRGQIGDEVVNRAAGKNCFVRTIIDSAGREIEVIRYRKAKAGSFKVPGGDDGPSGSGLLVYVDGTDMTRGTVKETERFVSELIGLDYDSFVRAVYFDGHAIAPFPTLTDKEIKAIFEKVLGLEDLSKAADVVKAKKNTIAANITRLNYEISTANSEISTADVEILTAKDRANSFVADIAGQVADLERQDKEVLASAEDPAVIDAEETKVLAEQKEHEAKLADFIALDGMVAKFNADVGALHSTRAAKVAERSAQEKALGSIQPPTELVSEMATLKFTKDQAYSKKTAGHATMTNAEAKIGKPCGECGKVYEAGDLQAIVDHGKRHFEAGEAEESAATTKIAECVVKMDAAKIAMADTIKAHIAAIDETIAGLDGQIAAMGERKAKLDELARMRSGLQIKAAEYPIALAAISARRDTITRLHGHRMAIAGSIEALKAKANPYLADIDRWAERKNVAQGAVMKCEIEVAGFNRTNSILQVLEKAYGRTGLKAHILETVTPVLNARANEYATRLADGQVKIVFDTVTKNKDGSVVEKFSVVVTNDHGAEGYLGNSSGERKKIDLAIALALSDLVAARSSKPIDLFVADEIAESLDQTALERVAELLRDKARERGTLLAISHADLTTYIPNVITVQKQAGGSVLRPGRTW